MSAAVARGHGGDAGGDPPQQPNKLPTSCEATSKQKKKRGMSRSRNLDIAFEANGNKPLPIQFDLIEDTYKPVGPNASMFTRYLGNMIGHGISPHYPSWNDVPPEFKTSMIRRLRRFFLLDPTVPEWPMIRAGIERDSQDLYKDRKSKLKKHFHRVGGYEDIANAKRNRPPHVEQENWDKTVDLFLDPKYRNRSQKNVQNRKHVKYPSLHGSLSYIATRFNKKNPETQELQSSIDNWRDMHYRPTGGWVNDQARMDHEAMLAEQATQTQQSSSASSSSVNQKEIITKVLGERRGHIRGIGRKLKGSAFSSFFEPPQPPPPPQPPTNDAMRNIVDALNACTQYMHQLYGSISSSQPGCQFPPPPVIDTKALFASAMTGSQPQRPPQQPPQDEDEDEDEDEDIEMDS